MKKYIYRIVNILNDKCYVGQTKNYKQRWKEHKNLLNKNKHENQHLQDAWNKYGEENFKFEVIEYVENYNEKEIYWISFYNSTDRKYGYNIMYGGEEPPHINGSKLSREQAQEVRMALMKANTLDEVVAMFPCVTKGHISKINNGGAWKDESLKYPLCRPRPETFTDEEIDSIILDLKQGILKQKDIAKKYNCSRTTITAINQGVNNRREGVDYPIKKTRLLKLNTTQIKDIVDLLENTSKTFQEIADQYNITISSIYDINLGKRHRDITSRDKYPIRK